MYMFSKTYQAIAPQTNQSPPRSPFLGTGEQYAIDAPARRDDRLFLKLVIFSSDIDTTLNQTKNNSEILCIGGLQLDY